MPHIIKCRSCGMTLDTDHYHVRNPLNGNPCKQNFFGGYVCSDDCDRDATREMRASIDAHVDPSGHYSRKTEAIKQDMTL